MLEYKNEVLTSFFESQKLALNFTVVFLPMAFYSSTEMAPTGQESAAFIAQFLLPWLKTSDLPSAFKRKVSGQISEQRPQPTHLFWSTLIIFFSTKYEFLRIYECLQNVKFKIYIS